MSMRDLSRRESEEGEFAEGLRYSLTMARNLSLKSVTVDEVVDGVNVIHMSTLEETLFGREYWLADVEVRNRTLKAWMKRRGAHYYGEEKWVYDDEGGIAGLGFSVRKGVREAKRVGARVVIVENLS